MATTPNKLIALINRALNTETVKLYVFLVHDVASFVRPDT